MVCVRSVGAWLCLFGVALGWCEVQCYAWDSTQHINVLELSAVFNFVRYAVRVYGWHQLRLVHVVDSRVVSCVLAKGRSSSKLLNRILRRLCSLLLAADLYLLPVWTISQWNHGDIPSRVVSATGEG